MRTSTVFVALLVLPGCFLLPDIEFDVCGNGLVEPTNDEDCDVAEDESLGPNLECGAPDDPIRRCRYVCRVSADVPACPVGWRCGTDGICLFASGEYREVPTTALGAPARSLAIGDLDGDGRDDLLALTSIGLDYRFSGQSGLSDSTFDIPFDVRPDLQIAVTDVDDDDITDVAVPLGNGLLVLRGSPSRLPETIPYPQLTRLPQEFRFHAASIPDRGSYALGTDVVANRMCLVFGTDPFDRSVCNDPERSIEFPAALDVTQRTVVTSTRGEAFVNVHGDDRVYVYQLECPTSCFDFASLTITRVATLDLPGPSAPGMFVADVDGQGGSDLLVNGAEGAMVAYRGSTGFRAPERADFLERWPLDVGDLDGDGLVDFLTSDGVHLRRGDATVRTYSSFPTWREARFGDFNGDGFLDVAATASVGRVRILLNTRDGRFNQGDLVASARVRALTVGDYDGDLVDDVAFVQDEFENDPDAGTTIAVSYGTGLGVPTAPIQMGRLDFIQTLERYNIQTSHEPERISDLLVGTAAEADGTGLRSNTFLSGARIRRMSSLVTPPNPDGFSFAALALQAEPVDSEPPPPVHFLLLRERDAWLIRGSGEALFEQRDMSRIDFGVLCNTEPIEPICLSGQNIRLPDQVREAAFLVDRCSNRAFVLFEREGDYVCRPGPSDLIGRRLSTADLNRNERTDLLTVGDGPADSPSAIGWDLSGAVDDMFDAPQFSFVTPIAQGPEPVLDMVAIDVDADRDLELLVLNEGGVRVGDVSIEGGFRPRASPVLERVLSPRARLAVADVNGDGLQDVIVSDDAKLYTLLGRSRQLP